MAPSSPAVAPSQTRERPIAPHHYRPPTPRELRAQAVHRLQIGVLGLASMLLLVGLANIIMDRARVSDGAAAVAALPTARPLSADEAKAGGDPLADIGVVPDMPASKNEPPAAATMPSAGSAPRR